MKTQAYIASVAAVGFLALFAMGQMLAAEAPVPPMPDSLPDLSVKETYDWLGNQYVAALRLPDKKVRLERIAKLLDEFRQSHPGTYEAARATTLGGDVEHELGRHQAAITLYSEALQAFGKVAVPSDNEREEYLGYLYLKSGDSHTALGKYQDAVDMYKKAIIGHGGGVPFSTLAVHALVEPLTGLYGREKRWVEYQKILEELLERADEVPRFTLSQVVFQYVMNADRLRAMGKIDQKEHWRSLARVRQFLPLLLDVERKAVSRHLDAMQKEMASKFGFNDAVNDTIEEAISGTMTPMPSNKRDSGSEVTKPEGPISGGKVGVEGVAELAVAQTSGPLSGRAWLVIIIIIAGVCLLFVGRILVRRRRGQARK